MKAKHWIPLALFGVLVAFLAVGLTRDPRELPSPLVDKPAPAFNLPQLAAADQRFAPADMKGQVWLLNVWASWCTACREEHPVLVEFSRTQKVPLIGLDYKDQRADGLKVLARQGDPYKFSVTDLDGRAGIDWGVYGVPETFVIDKQGIIRYKQVGPITPEALQKTLLPLIERLQRA
jgi:cytochrome c biogenesis protein CcmG/thiol:disulfide interchange protein DsbE